jgi:hypothetical protein
MKRETLAKRLNSLRPDVFENLPAANYVNKGSQRLEAIRYLLAAAGEELNHLPSVDPAQHFNRLKQANSYIGAALNLIHVEVDFSARVQL